MTDRHVRPATTDDLDALTSFTLQEAVEAEGRTLDEATVRAAIGAALEDPRGKATYLIAEDDGGPLGHVSLFFEWSDWRCVPYVWVQSMFVAPAHRRTGVMPLLLAAVDELAAKEGAPEVRIYVHTTNARALKAWQREGFEDASYWMASRPIQSSS